MITTPEQQAVDAAITSRRSIRAYTPQPVAREDILQILQVAGRAPSGTNTQPWKVYVLEGERKQELSSAILAIHNDPEQARLHTEEYAYYPREWVSPYIDRRRKVGWDLYALLGLTRENKAGMAAQHGRNYEFFGAPVGLIFTIDRIMEQGSWLDYGMFLQSVMVAARARGLDTCPQAAFTQYHRVIGSVLNIPENETVVCGMALGYADTTKIENSLITERMRLEEFVKFVVKD
ncbi:nitroreductase [Oxalobacteraceae bacterium OTU3CINTB1]|nr:nitroreductase [Oxalobacteraceae bacterium OTU3CINTB1]